MYSVFSSNLNLILRKDLNYSPVHAYHLALPSRPARPRPVNVGWMHKVVNVSNFLGFIYKKRNWLFEPKKWTGLKLGNPKLDFLVLIVHKFSLIERSRTYSFEMCFIFCFYSCLLV